MAGNNVTKAPAQVARALQSNLHDGIGTVRKIVNADSMQERVEMAKSAAKAARERVENYAGRVTRYAIDVGKKVVEGLGRIRFPEPAATSSFVKIDPAPFSASYDRQQAPSLFGSVPIKVSADVLGAGILRDAFEASKQLVRTGNVPELYSAAKRRIAAEIGALDKASSSVALAQVKNSPQAEPFRAAQAPTKPAESLFGSKPITRSALNALGKKMKGMWPKLNNKSQFVDITPAAAQAAANQAARPQETRPAMAEPGQRTATERMRVVEYQGRSQLSIYNPVTGASDGRPLRYAGRDATGCAVAFDSDGSRVLAVKAKGSMRRRQIRDAVSMFNPVTSAGSVYLSGDGAGGVFYIDRNGEKRHQRAGMPAPVTIIPSDEPGMDSVPESPRRAEKRNAATEDDMIRARYAAVGAVQELGKEAIATLELSDAQKKLLEIGSLNDNRLASGDSEWEDLLAKYHKYLETLGRLTQTLRKSQQGGLSVPGYA